MPTFQPSKFSTTSPGPARARPNVEHYVEVRDSQGTKFSIRSNGTIELLSTGRIWTSADGDVYTSIVANLAAYGDNKAKLEAVLGANVVNAALAKPKLPAARPPAGAKPGGAAAVEGAAKAGKIPFYKQPWFWPVVLLGVAGTAGVAYVYWPRDEEEEEPEYIPPPPPAPSATTRRSRASIARAEVKAKKALPPPPQEEVEVEEVVEDEVPA